MVSVGFSVQNKLGKIQFFEETFLLVETSIEVVLRMFFLVFGNMDI